MKRLIATDEQEPKLFYSLKEIAEYDDLPRDTIQLDSYFEEDDREKAFIYLDDGLLWGREKQSHPAIIDEYSISKKLPEDVNKQSFYDLASGNDEALAGHSITTGVYGEKVALFGDNYILKNADPMAVTQKLTDNGKYPINKVYFCTNLDNLIYERLAKTYKKLIHRK